MTTRRRGPDRPVGFESLEGRVLLATAPPAPALPAGQPVTQVGEFQARVWAPPVRHRVPAWSPGGRPDPTLHGRLKFTVDTWTQAHQLAYSHDVIRAGYHYAKLVVSKDTANAGLAYLKAAVRGNGKQLLHLGSSAQVKQVTSNFDQLGHTNVVRHVGQAFSRFGHSVAKQFNVLFKKK
jgi:hypothetical protein